MHKEQLFQGTYMTVIGCFLTGSPSVLFLVKDMNHTDGRREEDRPTLPSHSAKANSPLNLGQEGQPKLCPSSTVSPKLVLTHSNQKHHSGRQTQLGKNKALGTCSGCI